MAQWGSVLVGLVVSLALLIGACKGANTRNEAPDAQATIDAAVQATIAAAIPTPSPTPTAGPTPVTLEVMPTPTATPTPTPTLSPVPSPTPMPTPTPSPTARPTPTPTSTPVPTPLPEPTPTATPLPSATEIVERLTLSVVKIIVGEGIGTGVAIDSDGLILTANHVSPWEAAVEVEFHDGTREDGTILGRLLAHDIALIKVDKQNLHAAMLGDSGDLQQGDPLIKMGFALGSDDLSVTSGVLSGFREDLRFGTSWVQTDSALNPGDSGGPMLNARGEVVAIVTNKMVGLSVEGVGFGVTINNIKPSIDALSRGETICQPKPETVAGNQYFNYVHHWGVVIPENVGWVFAEWDDGYAVFGKIEDFAPVTKGIPLPVGVVVLPPVSSGSNPEEFATEMLNDINDTGEGRDWAFFTIRPVCSFIEGAPLAVEVETSLIRANTEFRERWRVFRIAGQYYVLQGIAWPERWDLNEKLIDSMLYSFAF